jgi:hypothetical protein
MPKSYFIYGLLDPIDEKIHYVGLSKTPWNRLHQHLSYARNPKSRMSTSQWIANLLAKELRPQLLILEEYKTDWRYDAKDVEKQWIAHYHGAGAPLVNRQIPTKFERYSRILPGRSSPRKSELKLDPVSGWYWTYE